MLQNTYNDREPVIQGHFADGEKTRKQRGLGDVSRWKGNMLYKHHIRLLSQFFTAINLLPASHQGQGPDPNPSDVM